MLKEQFTGQGRVVLLAGGGRIYTDIAARFVRSERSLDEIIASPYSKRIVDNILNSGHGAALEFDYFLFGVEGESAWLPTLLSRAARNSEANAFFPWFIPGAWPILRQRSRFPITGR